MPDGWRNKENDIIRRRSIDLTEGIFSATDLNDNSARFAKIQADQAPTINAVKICAAQPPGQAAEPVEIRHCTAPETADRNRRPSGPAQRSGHQPLDQA